jgi:hypothetical protein
MDAGYLAIQDVPDYVGMTELLEQRYLPQGCAGNAFFFLL